MNVKLTEEQLRNLEIFLDRVEYKGRRESLALLELLNAFQQARANEEERE